MDETDFDALVESTSPHEVKRLWKVLSEWCDGEENSFPVHLALLTRAQWRAAARIPQLVKESTKLMELIANRRWHRTGETFSGSPIEFLRQATVPNARLRHVTARQSSSHGWRRLLLSPSPAMSSELRQ